MGGINLNNLKKNDSWVTPKEAVKPLLREFSELSNVKTIDPFGNSLSNFNAFKELLQTEVIYGDFFTLNPDIFLKSIIITNPPFSIKDEVIIALFDLYNKKIIKGFAILLPLPSLQGITRGTLFQSVESIIRVRIFSKRIKYIYPTGDKQSNGCMFGSIWICLGELFTKRGNLKWY